ncbi:hypothetical protein K466DRAFT_583917 [Polyporus arcularius HHB13444]|uniref:Uncharacterized protein n=1 Tax=Polyporus arcularius HHB13444 TaxID=1314778 RepID=A0A5C3PW09_9APHY|nr:hypothetical protein K466DRAFT_583917 [Polyporus arcularius HHB13444]
MAVYVSMVLVQFATFPSDESCSMFQIALEAISIAQYVPGAIFSALRAYVLSRSKPLGFLVLALSLAPVGANLVQPGHIWLSALWRELPAIWMSRVRKHN